MFPWPLNLAIAPSKRLRHALLGLNGLAIAALWLTQMPTPAQALANLFIAGSAMRLWHPKEYLIALRCGKDAVISMRAGPTTHPWASDAPLPGEAAGGPPEQADWAPLQLAGPPLLLAGAAILRMRIPGRRRASSLLILPDSLPEQDFRRLRVWLRWRAREGSKAADSTSPP